jgi:hypothetical protein
MTIRSDQRRWNGELKLHFQLRILNYWETDSTMNDESIDLSKFSEGSKVTLSSEIPFLRRRKGVIMNIDDEYVEFNEIVNGPHIYANNQAPRYILHTIAIEAITEIESRTGRY